MAFLAHLPDDRYLHDETDLILLHGMRHVRVVRLPWRCDGGDLLERWEDCVLEPGWMGSEVG